MQEKRALSLKEEIEKGKSIVDVIKEMIEKGKSEGEIIKALVELGLDEKKARHLLIIVQADISSLIQFEVKKELAREMDEKLGVFSQEVAKKFENEIERMVEIKVRALENIILKKSSLKRKIRIIGSILTIGLSLATLGFLTYLYFTIYALSNLDMVLFSMMGLSIIGVLLGIILLTVE